MGTLDTIQKYADIAIENGKLVFKLDIVVLLEKIADSTDNKVDDKLVAFLKPFLQEKKEDEDKNVASVS